MKKTAWLFLWVVVTLTSIITDTFASGGVQRPVFLGASDAPYGYYEYLPEGYQADLNKKWPVVVFLHGAGEWGNGLGQLKNLLQSGPPANIAEGAQYPFILISPQSPDGWEVSDLDRMIEFVKSNYQVDEKRIYLTGLSVGGGGTWSYAVVHPEKLAAIVPVCGAANSYLAENLVNLPVWAFHSWGDEVVSSSYSVDWLNQIAGALLEASPTDLIANYPGKYTGPPGNGKIPDKTRTASFDPEKGWTWVDDLPDMPQISPILTLYKSTLHDCWSQTYNDPRMWNWLLAQKRTTVVQKSELSGVSGMVPNSAYLGQAPPEETPVKFILPVAKDCFAAERIGVSPGGKEIYYSELNGYPASTSRIKYFTYSEGKWNGPKTLFEGFMGPALSPGGKTLYYQRDENGLMKTYFSTQTDSKWSEPKRLLNTLGLEHYLQKTNRGEFYVATYEGGRNSGTKIWAKVSLGKNEPIFENLPFPVNTHDNGVDFFIARDESFLITCLKGDLWISFRKTDGTWTLRKNLGSPICTAAGEWGPYVTADNRYLFYSSDATNPPQIYWVKVDQMIKRLKQTNFPPYLNSEFKDQLAVKGVRFEFSIPEDVFIDDDGNYTLSYSAALIDGKRLPVWLRFDADTATFSGKPNKVGTFNIKVTATDTEKARVTCTFTLRVTQ